MPAFSSISQPAGASGLPTLDHWQNNARTQAGRAFVPIGTLPFPTWADGVGGLLSPDAERRALIGFEIAANRVPGAPDLSLMGQVIADAAINARNAINRGDLPFALATEIKDTLVGLGNRLADGQPMPALHGDFRDYLFRLAAEPITSNSYRDALMQMQTADFVARLTSRTLSASVDSLDAGWNDRQAGQVARTQQDKYEQQWMRELAKSNY
jgi:hypothetical protein